MFIHRVTSQIRKALGLFTPNEVIKFDPNNETICSFDPFALKPNKKLGFIANLYASLPKHTKRRFIFATTERDPSPKEYRALEREILGKARQILTQELKARIQRLPHQIGKRKGFTKQMRQELRARVEQETERREKEAIERGETPKRGYKDETVRAIAKKLGFKNPRQVWRLIRDV